jgi:Lon protease-like protein
MLPETLPIFPLPNVVLFPDVFLPLHVFEPRYRDLTRAALDQDRIIGMVLLRQESASESLQRVQEYVGETASIFPVGCAGLITHVEQVEDGRYNIILRGIERFRVAAEEENPERRYRVARIEPMPDRPFDKDALREERRRLESLLVSSGTENFSFRLPPSMPDVEFVHALAQYFTFDPIERQALLELPDAIARCKALIDLVEIQLLMGSKRWTTSH